MNPPVSSNSIPPAFQMFDSAAAEEIIIKFICCSVQESGASGVVLGLSGGIDSALVAALAVKALGPENVFPIFFYHSENESDEFDSIDLRDAALLADKLGLTLQKINLAPVLRSAEAAVAEKSPEALTEQKTPPLQETAVMTGNLKSRLRMSLLYRCANQNHLLVIGTKNKTERMTGYFTKYGDGGVDIDPIADLYKTEVRLLSKYLDLPDRILTKIPSAGFWEGQADENELGLRYEQLDTLLAALERKKIKPNSKKFNKLALKIGLNRSQSQSIAGRLDAAVHKQKMPPIPKMPKPRKTKKRTKQ